MLDLSISVSLDNSDRLKQVNTVDDFTETKNAKSYKGSKVAYTHANGIPLAVRGKMNFLEDSRMRNSVAVSGFMP